MSSHKWTFSLKILVVLLALALVVPHVFAGDFKVELSIEDVSFADKSFPEYQHDIQVEFSPNTRVYVKFDKVVEYRGGRTQDLPAGENYDAFKDTGIFTHHDVVVLIYNEIGQVFATITGADTVVIEPRDRHDGKNYTVTFNTRQDSPRIEDYNRVLVYIKQGSVTAVDPAVTAADSKNAEGSVAFDLVFSDGQTVAPDGFLYTDEDQNTGPHVRSPAVYGISTTVLRARAGVTEPFEVKIRLSEKPREGTLTTDHINVTEGKATEIFFLGTVDAAVVFGADGDPFIRYPPPTGRGPGHIYYDYLVTIEPKFENKNDIVIKVNAFEDLVKPNGIDPNAPYKYTPPISENEYIEGFDKLTVKVGKEDPKDKTAGIEVPLLNEGIIPKDGYLVVTKSRADSAVRDPSGTADGDDPKEVPSTTNRQPFGRTYNIVGGGDLPNLETFLINGGTIDLVSPDAGLVISEIMWGSDASIPDSFKSQYIEIRNTSGSQITMGKEDYRLVFYGAGQTLPDMSVAAKNIQDRVGTVGTSGYWSVAGKGQSGRTGIGEAPGDLAAITPTQELISMQRSIDTTGVAADGTMASSWVASEPPGLNFDPTKEGTRIGSPGRAPVAYPVAPTPEPAPVTVPVAMPEDIMITEIMVDTGDGRLPQWIELSNVSGAEVSLAGWSLMVTNSEDDADVVGSSLSIDLSSAMLGISEHEGNKGKGKTLLLVGGTARSSSNLSESMEKGRAMDVSDQLDETGRYAFISPMAFMIALIPPQETGVLAYSDTAGNLGADAAWDIPMSENGRSSLIRREMLDDGMATMGTSANGWVLASSTSLVSGPTTWYGSDEDAGTPGYDNGGPLPVELSHFRPARDAAGAVVITWSTQSELNNAGFFIKRSQQRDGQFEVINTTLIAGAGTTSEKQFYTYTDTTAQPNVVYYYQIEDVSLDGNRQTLTNGIRLKGHIGAAGKLTTTWGDLKTSNQ